MIGYLKVISVFIKMGLLSFGGGYAIMPVAERELIKKRAWTTMDELMDYYTIAQITPGLIGVNLATFVGYKRKGALGGILATLGYVLPSATLVLIAALFISNFAGLPAVRNAFAGIRIAVGALILDTVVKLLKNVFKDIKAIVIYIIVFAVSVLPHRLVPSLVKSPVTLVLLSGLAGLYIYRQRFREKTPAPSEKDKA